MAFAVHSRALGGFLILSSACSPDAGGEPPGGGPGAGGAAAAAGGTAAGGADPSAGGAGSGGIDAAGGFGGEGSGGIPPSGGTGGLDPYPNRVPAGAVCERLSTLQCAAEAACCATPRPFDACKATMKNQCANEVYLDEMSANPVAGYDMAHAEAAFTTFEQKAAVCDVGIASWASTVDGLRGIAQGTLDGGGNCTENSFYKPAIAAHLVACRNPATTSCMPGVLGAPWTCQPRSANGGPCFTDLNCADGYYCDNPDLALPPGHSCVPRKGDGSPCAFPNECASLTCKGGVCVTPSTQTAYCLAQ